MTAGQGNGLPTPPSNEDGFVVAFAAELDALLRLAANACAAPIAIVAAKDRDGRDWRRHHGTDVPVAAIDAVIAALDDSAAVPDLLADPRWAESEAVRAGGIRSCIALPLDSGGVPSGTLLVFDHIPRDLSEREWSALRIVAARIDRQIRPRRSGALAALGGKRSWPRIDASSGFARNILDSTTNGVVVLDLDGTFIYVNRRALDIAGYGEHEVLGCPFSILFRPSDIPAMRALFERAITLGESVESLEATILRKDGREATVKFSGAPVERDGAIVAVTITAEDITERKRTDGLVAAQRRLLETMALRSDLRPVLNEIATAVEQQSDALCSIMLLHEDGETLRTAAAPSLPPSFVDAIDGLRIGPSVGSCGTAAFRRAPVISPDVRTDPLWIDGRELMDAHGLRSSWSCPFFDASGVVLGTLAMYSPEPGAPGEWDMQVIEFATHLAAIAVQRDRVRTRTIESEERLRDLFENANDIFYTHDVKGTFLSVNAAGMRTYNISPEEIGTLNIADIVDPVWLDRAVESIRRKAVDGGDTEPYELLTRARDGSDVWVEVNTRIVRRDGQEPFIQGIARDVTERRRAEDALQRSEWRYRTLAENVFDVVAETDTQGRICAVTENVEHYLGYTPDELIGRVYLEFVHPADAEAVLADVRRALQAAAGQPRQLRFRHKDGSMRWFETSATSYTENGETRVVSVSRDITERVRITDSLRASEQRLRTFVRNAPVILFALDRDGVFTLYEGQGLERVGLHPEQFVGQSVFEVHAHQAAILANTRRGLAGEAFVDIIDIRGVAFEAHHTPILNDDGEPDGLIGVLINVTDRRRAEGLVSVQRELLEMVAVGAPLEAVLTSIAQSVESHTPGGVCTLMLIDAEGAALRQAAQSRLPVPLVELLDGTPASVEGPAPAAAAALADTVISGDIASDGRWNAYREPLLHHGIRACWSVPIRGTTGNVLGTLNVYFTTEKTPDDGDLDVIEMATHIAGIAIERKRVDESVRSRSADLEKMYQQLMQAHTELEESKAQLEEKSVQLERALETERDRARRDPLTGLLNHAAITDALRDFTSQAKDQVLALAMVDVDGLKAANDTYGHPIGDAVLVMVADKLSRQGAIVGRYGGDEFVAILPGADRTAALAYRTAVLESLSGAGLIDPESGANVPVVISVGIAIYPEEAAAVDDLIRLSDSAMYASRRERPDGPGRTLNRTLGGDRAAKMVGEIVPLLTSAGTTEDKLRLVAHRLSVGAGYDGVHFVIEDERETGVASSSFARVPEADLESWDEDQSTNVNRRIAQILNRTRRPIVVDDLATNELLPESTRTGLAAIGLRSCLIAPMLWEDTLIGAMSVASKRHAAFSVRDAEFGMAVATQVTAIVQMSRVVEKLRTSSSHLLEAHESTVMMLASAAEAHDRTTGRHLERVRLISEALAHELGYDDAAAKELGMAAILHDIGKIRVPDTVLGSSQSLAEAEWVLMKQHTVWGSAFLNGQPGFELAAMVARCHHERWDGAGYPDGLAADNIPDAAQITTVADSFDAMTNDRPYRNGRPIADAVDEIVACSGTQFSPRIVEALVRLFHRGELNFLHNEYPTNAAA